MNAQKQIDALDLKIYSNSLTFVCKQVKFYQNVALDKTVLDQLIILCRFSFVAFQ